MEKRHQDLLMNRLEDAFHNGCSHVTWNELYLWYSVQKLAARTYRDLEARWQDITDNRVGRLMRVDGRGGMFIFGEKTAEKVDQNNLLDQL